MSFSPFRSCFRRGYLPHIQVRSLARMTLIGRLAAAPELASTVTGREMVRYVVGVTKGPPTDRQTSWFKVNAFPSTDNVRDFLINLPKGQAVAVDADGRMRSLPVEGDQPPRKVLDLVQRSIEVVGARAQPKDSAEESATSTSETEA